MTVAVSMEVGGVVASAARRRRERRLRSWWKHELQAVRMALSAAVQRGQKTASSGTRPEPLEEVSEPQVGAVTVRYVAAPVPFLSTPLLADAAAKAVDARTVKYLLKAALRRREEEEEMLEIHRKVRADLPVTDAEWAAWKALRGIGSSSSGEKKRGRGRRGGRSAFLVLVVFLDSGMLAMLILLVVMHLA